MEAHGAQTERLASVASGAVSDVADESPQAADTAGGSASSVEDDTVHEAPIEVRVLSSKRTTRKKNHGVGLGYVSSIP